MGRNFMFVSNSIETKNSKADSNSENRFFGIDLKIVIRVREKGNSYLMLP